MPFDLGGQLSTLMDTKTLIAIAAVVSFFCVSSIWRKLANHQKVCAV